MGNDWLCERRRCDDWSDEDCGKFGGGRGVGESLSPRMRFIGIQTNKCGTALNESASQDWKGVKTAWNSII